MTKWKSVSKDFIYNIAASFALTGALQIVVYPVLAQKFSADVYGTLLTIMGIVNAIAVTFGNSLNSVRLIMNEKYEESGVEGDFNLLLSIAAVLSLILVIVIGDKYFHLDKINLIGIGLYVVFMILRSYFYVEFRLALNFKKILYANLFSALGCLLGAAGAFLLPYWTLPFAVGELFYVLFILFQAKIYKESYSFTIMLGETSRKYGALIISGVAANFLTYLDRLLIYPMLGSEAVSIYTVASVFGKSLGLLMTPISSVLLGYYAQKNFKMDGKLFWKINLTTVAAALIFIACAQLFAPFVLSILYPGLYDAASSYVFVANLAATISVMSIMTQSAVLKFAPTWIQVVKEALYALVYVGCGMWLLNRNGLMGFCIAAVLANLIRLIVLYVLGNHYINVKHANP